MKVLLHGCFKNLNEKLLQAHGIVFETVLLKKAMSTVKNLSNAAAIDKIKELAEGKMCLFCTKENGKIISRPMGASQVDDSGDLWFFSPRSSNKNRQLQLDPEVYLMF
ncbi:MAG: hypothetical protein EOO03_16245, partial [Chitinophagaceae bacterium]